LYIEKIKAGINKGGLPAALFKPRTVKGTASQATPPGRCLAYTRR